MQHRIEFYKVVYIWEHKQVPVSFIAIGAMHKRVDENVTYLEYIDYLREMDNRIGKCSIISTREISEEEYRLLTKQLDSQY